MYFGDFFSLLQKHDTILPTYYSTTYSKLFHYSPMECAESLLFVLCSKRKQTR